MGGATYEWIYHEWKIYPKADETQIALASITKDDLKFIEPLNQVATYSSNPNAYKANVQSYCSPKIVDLGNNKMLMTYIDDSVSRSAENRTVLMYSIFDGTTWNTPQPVLDDGTMDYAPVVYSDNNGGVHIIWQNAKELFDSDVTLEEMSSNMELYYTYWNGSTFEGTTAITNNLDYETNYSVTADGNNLSVVWQQNSENDPFALEGTNSIYRKQLSSGVWQNEELISSNLSVVNSIDCSYVNNSSVVAYSVKTNTDTSTVDDMEVYFYSNGVLTKVTENAVSDFSVCFAGSNLYWMSGNSILCMADGNIETVKSVIGGLTESVTSFNVLENYTGQKAIVWEQKDDTTIKFYGAYYNGTLDEYGTISPLTTGDDVIRGWDACMMPDGEIQLAYCAADALAESVDGRNYGQIDLIQKNAEEFYDISVGQIVTYNNNVVAGEEIILNANVYNCGSKDITKFNVDIIDKDGVVISSCIIEDTLSIGGSANLNIPFTLPSQITRMDYTLKITPYGGSDVFATDNDATFGIGFADLAIKDLVEVTTDSGRQLQITITNQGFETINSAQLKVFTDSAIGELLATQAIEQIDVDEQVILTYNIDVSDLNSNTMEPNLYYIILETPEHESNYSNNTKDVYVYPNCSVTLTAGDGGLVQGAGSYSYNTTVTIEALPNDGYIFAGWYENGKLLDNVLQEYTFTIFSNRSLEARFIPNDLEIIDLEIFGTLGIGELISFIAEAEGGYQSYSWEFYIYKDDTECHVVTESALNFIEWSPTELGDYTIVIYATDANGFRVSYTEQFSIE